jgi:hypothetical protein
VVSHLTVAGISTAVCAELTPVEFEFVSSSPDGFTRRQFAAAVHEGYRRIYATAGEPSHSGGMYGVWGHSIVELFLEGWEEDQPGRYGSGPELQYSGG